MINTLRVVHRFHVSGVRATGEEIALPEDEARHLTRVLRLGVGAGIRVFDGRGHEFDAVVRRVAKDGVVVAVEASRPAAGGEARVAITLAQAVLKGDKMDDVVRDAVMMGVAVIQPVVTARSEVSLASIARAGRRDRWERIAVSSAKQCGRAVVPAVLEPCAFESFAKAIEPRPGGADPLQQAHWRVMCVEPSALTNAVTIGELGPSAPRDATVVIGPEGGWTPEELATAAPHCRFVRLGSRTLRADAAPLVALAALLAIWGEL